MARRATPARRVKARRQPAIALPPKPPVGDRESALANMRVTIGGVAYLLGRSIEGDPTMQATIDGTATLTVAVRDTDAVLQRALGTEAKLLKDSAVVVINGVVYALQSLSVDDTGSLVSLVFEDQVSWRLKRFSRFLAINRSRSTRAQAALRLVEEASTGALAPLRYYIPQLGDRQRIAVAGAVDTDRTKTRKGTGAAAGYAVKGVRADAQQRKVIDGALGEAHRLGASRRVMIAVVMTMTQESVCRRIRYGDQAGPDSRGPYQQRAPWGPLGARLDPVRSTRMFLTGGRGGQPGWKQVHGSVKNAPANLESAIKRVQVSVGGYAQWGKEATRTVDAWLGGARAGGAVAGPTNEPYEFTRGEKGGQRESSWDALGRWAEEVGWRRWAAGNVLYFISDEELRASAPALQVDGDEPYLLAPPSFDWSPDRATTEAQIRVLADRWGVSVGAAVVLDTGGPADGRYVVASVDGAMVAPEVAVTLHRPAAAKLEPAPETAQTGDSPDVKARTGTTPAAFHSLKLDGRWGGTQAIFDQFVHPFMRKRGLAPGSQKRGTMSTASGGRSDHWSGSKRAYATDYPTFTGAKAAGELARALRLTGWRPNTTGDYALTVAGARFRVQLIWGAAVDHGDHVHVGIKRL